MSGAYKIIKEIKLGKVWTKSWYKNNLINWRYLIQKTVSYICGVGAHRMIKENILGKNWETKLI